MFARKIEGPTFNCNCYDTLKLRVTLVLLILDLFRNSDKLYIYILKLLKHQLNINLYTGDDLK